jgi:hypothetical protein
MIHCGNQFDTVLYQKYFATNEYCRIKSARHRKKQQSVLQSYNLCIILSNGASYNLSIILSNGASYNLCIILSNGASYKSLYNFIERIELQSCKILSNGASAPF